MLILKIEKKYNFLNDTITHTMLIPIINTVVSNNTKKVIFSVFFQLISHYLKILLLRINFRKQKYN